MDFPKEADTKEAGPEKSGDAFGCAETMEFVAEIGADVQGDLQFLYEVMGRHRDGNPVEIAFFE